MPQQVLLVKQLQPMEHNREYSPQGKFVLAYTSLKLTETFEPGLIRKGIQELILRATFAGLDPDEQIDMMSEIDCSIECTDIVKVS